MARRLHIQLEKSCLIQSCMKITRLKTPVQLTTADSEHCFGAYRFDLCSWCDLKLLMVIIASSNTFCLCMVGNYTSYKNLQTTFYQSLR